MKRLLAISLWIPSYLLLITCPVPLDSVEAVSPCVQIDEVFQLIAVENEYSRPACHCFLEQSSSDRRNMFQEPAIWIGCNRDKLTHVFNSLTALNETVVSEVRIWDSIFGLIPPDMFTQVRPRILSIQRSRLNFFRTDAFNKVGQSLKVLELRHNYLNELDTDVFRQLNRLTVLDLGDNKISKILKGQLDELKDLEALFINRNHLVTIEDGAFQSLTDLKTLNLANNHLSNITEFTFRGLDNLVDLYLQGNGIISIDWKAFAHLKNLKTLDLGNNQLEKVELYGLNKLEKLLINDNSIESMKDVVLRDLNHLKFLSLDRNFITHISDGDLHSLGECGRLMTLSLAYNQIATIETRALEPIHSVEILSLQDNVLTSLSHSIDGRKMSFLHPLGMLKQLFLGNNSLTEIDRETFGSLMSLKTLVLDNNRIEKIDREAFSDLSLTQLYLSNNYLSYIPKGIFNSIENTLSAMDLSENPWQCICGEEWLPDWLTKMGDSVLRRSLMGCMWSESCSWELSESRNPWVAIIAGVLALITLLILVTIGFLFFEDGKRLRRTASDMVHLIPNNEDANQSLHEKDDEVVVAPVKTGNGKKRVRFDGV